MGRRRSEICQKKTKLIRRPDWAPVEVREKSEDRMNRGPTDNYGVIALVQDEEGDLSKMTIG